MFGIIGCAYANRGNALLYGLTALERGGSNLIIVVYDVHIHALSPVASVACPVVEHVVAQVKALVGLRAWARPKARNPTGVMCQQVVMIGASASTPVASIAVGTLAVSGIHEALRADGPLHGDVLTSINRYTLVYAPAHGAMVYDDVVLIHAAESVALMIGHILVTQSEAHVAYDSIVATYLKRVVGYAYTVAWCRLPEYGYVVFV